jgi:hypothetical protein
MVTDAQVGVLRRKRMAGKTQEAAAASAGMSVRSARKWEHGLFPSQRCKPRTWRTREDPMATAAAIDRLVHHATILEFNVPSYRTRKRRKNDAGQAARIAGRSERPRRF